MEAIVAAGGATRPAVRDTPMNLSGVEGNTSRVTSGFTQERVVRNPR